MAIYDVEARFKEKLYSQFKNSTNINELFEVRSTTLQDTVDAIEFILGQLSIDDRQGDLLDKLGTRLGVARPFAQEPDESLFTLYDVGDVGIESQGFSDEDYQSEGGYLADEKGLQLQSDPLQKMSDSDYRSLLKQKAASWRRRATRQNLFDYLIAFGAQCIIQDDEVMDIVFDTVDYDALNDFEKWYVINKGFKPAGISTAFRERMRASEAI